MLLKGIDLNALMFSPNFDEYPDEPEHVIAQEFRFPFRVFLAGIIVGAIVSGTIVGKIYSSGNSIQMDLSTLAIKICKLFS
ncbi:hypothetical protein [Chamaesiphon minutus]|uniref:Uncharacterized protein n=1 Tax=Chamaesiphon minutus (strain ATCC 27169 / PCC 6605) TaxID=1173020 RepID=K9UBU1_CHAP6|nr:hypothetical protein [Chamaesiphon minutus]AFY91896.1 hypothetical protein Cha6605_0619 [Chamaesiphon minutus PCC 6605]